MAAAALPGLNFGPEVTYILAAILIITGLALAFYGHGLWTTVMSMIGALLGSAVGFLFGAALSSNIAVGLILALVGAVIGSILFTKLVKVALAFVVGLLAAALVYGLLRGSANFTGQMDPPLVGAILVLIVVFGISYYFIDDIIGIITAAIGGLLLALGLYLLTNTIVTPGLAGLGVFLLGALVQTATIKRKQRARTRAAATPPPPPPPPIEQANMDLREGSRPRRASMASDSSSRAFAHGRLR